MNSVKYFVIVTAVMGLLSCSSKSKETSGSNSADSYSTLVVEPYDVTLYREFPATLKGEQVVEILPKVDGYIQHIYVKEGQRVKKGQLLFEIFNPSYEQSISSIEASIKSAQADLATAKIDYENTKALVERKVIGDFQLKTQQNTVDSKEQVLAELRAELETQQTNRQYTKITAPADGVISTIPYKVGALVSSSSTEGLTTLSNSTNVLAYFSVSETDLLSYGNQLGIEGYLILPNDSLYSSKGVISQATDIVNTETGSITYSATFPNAAGALRSGGFATVRIPYVAKQVLTIPQTATYEVQNKVFVYVLDANNKINSRMVDVVPTSNGQYYIVKSGLKKGESIVLEGVGLTLKDGMLIKPVPAKSDSIFSQISTME